MAEDESVVRKPVRRILEQSGYRVVEAEDGAAALALAERYDGPIHLLLTDVVMPRMDGGELARRLGETRPHTRVLFISGFSAEAVATHGRLVPGAGFLAKPFSAVELLDRVRATLGGSPLSPGRTTPRKGELPHSRK
jgi:DNA-binding response OmpR family regulator